MPNKNITNWTEIIITAIITSMLTLVCSYVMMKKQLSEEQNYWSQRFRTERAQDILNKKISLFQDINSDILESEVLAKETKLALSSLYAEIESCKNGIGDCDYKKIEIEKKVSDYHKHINRIAAKIQMISVYYPHNIELIVEPLSLAIQENYQSHLMELTKKPKTESHKVEDYFQGSFDTINKLTEIRLKLLREMLNDINSYAKDIYIDK